jgi:hypothetical protein
MKPIMETSLTAVRQCKWRPICGRVEGIVDHTEMVAIDDCVRAAVEAQTLLSWNPKRSKQARSVQAACMAMHVHMHGVPPSDQPR